MSYYPPNYRVTFKIVHDDYDSGNEVVDISKTQNFDENKCNTLEDAYRELIKLIKAEKGRHDKSSSLLDILT